MWSFYSRMDSSPLGRQSIHLLEVSAQLFLAACCQACCFPGDNGRVSWELSEWQDIDSTRQKDISSNNWNACLRAPWTLTETKEKAKHLLNFCHWRVTLCAVLGTDLSPSLNSSASSDVKTFARAFVCFSSFFWIFCFDAAQEGFTC